MMTFLFWFLLVFFVLVCIIINFLVLIQSDKGGGISGAIGGGLGGASSLLGTQDTANILTRGTVGFGCAFFALCIILSLVMSKQTVDVGKSLLQKRAEKMQDFSPSSVLDKGGLPVRTAEEGAGELPSAGGEATASGSANQQQASPAAVPEGAIPIKSPKEAAKK